MNKGCISYLTILNLKLIWRDKNGKRGPIGKAMEDHTDLNLIPNG
jgi:hypothetical protein